VSVCFSTLHLCSYYEDILDISSVSKFCLKSICHLPLFECVRKVSATICHPSFLTNNEDILEAYKFFSSAIHLPPSATICHPSVKKVYITTIDCKLTEKKRGVADASATLLSIYISCL